MFHYWSNKYVLPRLKEHGIQVLEDFFLRYLQMTFAQTAARPRRFISIGAGNCDFEILLCKRLVEQGHRNFVMECLDFNEDALRRGEQAARGLGLGLTAMVVPVLADINSWLPDKHYDCVIANQSLHHVANLEGLFDAIALSLGHNGWFVTSDMIGRNGHARWPEAKEIIDEYWSSLTKQQRFNHISGRVEHQFLNPPPNPGNFEGIRAQDILSLLVARFGFEFFYGFSNIIAPFVDRTFGPNFDPHNAHDRMLIDAIQARDEREMIAGRIKPTQMLAAMTLSRNVTCKVVGGLAPRAAIRQPD